MTERDLLVESKEWYEKHTRLVPADFLDRSMGKPEFLYVGFLLAMVKGLSERVQELESRRS